MFANSYAKMKQKHQIIPKSTAITERDKLSAHQRTDLQNKSVK
jgi:hypothetical protein